jgi:hypothetical protein
MTPGRLVFSGSHRERPYTRCPRSRRPSHNPNVATSRPQIQLDFVATQSVHAHVRDVPNVSVLASPGRTAGLRAVEAPPTCRRT